MADRDVYGGGVHDDCTLPSGIRPIVGILLSVIAIAGWLFLAAVFHHDDSTDAVKVDPQNVQMPSGSNPLQPTNP